MYVSLSFNYFISLNEENTALRQQLLKLGAECDDTKSHNVELRQEIATCQSELEEVKQRIEVLVRDVWPVIFIFCVRLVDWKIVRSKEKYWKYCQILIANKKQLLHSRLTHLFATFLLVSAHN